MMEERFGVRPTLVMYDHYFSVDNEAGTCTIDRQPIDLEQDAAD